MREGSSRPFTPSAKLRRRDESVGASASPLPLSNSTFRSARKPPKILPVLCSAAFSPESYGDGERAAGRGAERSWGGVPLKKPTHPFGWLSSRGSVLGRAGGLSRPWGRRGGQRASAPAQPGPPQHPPASPCRGHLCLPPMDFASPGRGRKAVPHPGGVPGGRAGFWGAHTPPTPRAPSPVPGMGPAVPVGRVPQSAGRGHVLAARCANREERKRESL